MYYTIIFVIILFLLIRKNKFEKWKNIQNDNYFSFFNKNDYTFRNCNTVDECKSLYGSSELLLSPFEKKKIKEFIGNLVKGVNFKYMFVFNGISIVKVDNRIENSLPHTRGRHIILSKNWIDKFLADRYDLLLEKLISHEQFHIYQRFNPKSIDNFYTKFWGMVKLKKKLPKEILEINRTNPDALPNINWLFKREKDFILPLCLYRENPTSLTDTENIYLRLDKNHNFINLLEDLENRQLLSNESKFKGFFGNEMSNNYHANELSASIFELIIEDLINKNIDLSKRPPAYHKMIEFLETQN